MIFFYENVLFIFVFAYLFSRTRQFVCEYNSVIKNQIVVVVIT